MHALKQMSGIRRKPVFGISDQVWHILGCIATEDVQPQMMKFWIEEVEGLYYLCRENKGADQLHGYHTAELHLCFCKNQVFS